MRILVGFPAGGTVDLIARVVADKMKDSLGQPVIVENKPGAIGRIAANEVKAAAPDGTTIMVMPIGPMAVVPHVYKDITYDPLKDFTPVALGATFQFAIAAGPASGAKNWKDFVAWVKANPGKASYATSGAGSLPHFFGVLLGRGIGVEMVHVPYKGSAAYINDLISGQVPAAIDAIADLTELHRAGRVTILASSGATRSTALPDVPTFKELGVKRRRGAGLVRVLRAGEDAEADRRHAESRDQSRVAVARRRGKADQGRHRPRHRDAGGIRQDRRVRLREMGTGRDRVGIQAGMSGGDDVILRVEGLRKSYGGNEVVRGLSFEIRRGDCFGLLGPNGAGKTTTLRCCLGLIDPDGGTIRMVGEEVPEAARQARIRVGVVPQMDNLDPDFTVRENLLIYGSYFGHAPRRAGEAHSEPSRVRGIWQASATSASARCPAG